VRIIEKLESLRRREHSATVELIAALVECYRTKAYLDAGYESIWDLLVRRLDYSFAAASRRNAATKIVARYPFVLEMLRSHRTSLTVLAKVVGPLNSADDPVALLESIDGKSQSEVERIVACGRPVAKPVERVRRQVVRKPAARPAPLLDCASEVPMGAASGAEVEGPNGAVVATSGAEVVSNAGRNGTSAAEARSPSAGPTPVRTSAAGATTATESPTDTEAAAGPATEERVSLSFSLTAEDYESFEQAKAILARKLPANLSLEDAFNKLVAFYLSKKRPAGKPKKKPKRKTRKQSAASPEAGRSAKNPTRGGSSATSTGHAVETKNEASRDDEVRPAASDDTRTYDSTEADRPHRPAAAPRSRHVPADTRAAVFDRDDHRCTFVAADGTRCNATRNLEIDHVQPFALGGSNEPQNLRVLCAAHNRRAAEHVFGPLPRRKSRRDRC
jgi:5-methylcytosine-specific restriction endonuclease McrA